MIELTDRFVFEYLSTRDRFFCGFCSECAFKGGLFVVRGRYVSLCSQCVLERIKKVELEFGGLPDDIETLRKEAIEEVEYQRRREMMTLSVDWNYLWKCRRCKHLMQRYEVRFIPAEEGAPVTHHKVCYACYLVYCAENPSWLHRKGEGPGGPTQATVSWY